MKRGKIILSAAAFIVTAGSIFAFKSHARPNAVIILGPTVAGGACRLSKDCFTTHFGGHSGDLPICHTWPNKVVTLLPGPNGTLFTARTIINQACIHPVLVYTGVR